MHAEYRSKLRYATPGCVCCAKFYVRQTDAVKYLIREHGITPSLAGSQVRRLVREAREQRRSQRNRRRIED